jgi:hypothetical protein
MDFITFYYLSAQDKQTFLESLPFSARGQYERDYDVWFFNPTNPITNPSALDFTSFYYLSGQDKQAYLESLPPSTRDQYERDYDSWFYNPTNPITNNLSTRSTTININYCINNNLNNISYTKEININDLNAERLFIQETLALYEGIPYRYAMNAPAPLLTCFNPIIDLGPSPSPTPPTENLVIRRTVYGKFCENGLVQSRSTVIENTFPFNTSLDTIKDYVDREASRFQASLNTTGRTGVVISLDTPPVDPNCITDTGTGPGPGTSPSPETTPPSNATRTLYASYCVQRLVPGLSSTQPIPTFPSTSSKVIPLTNVSAQQIQPFLFNQSQLFQEELRQSGATQIRIQFDSQPPNENCLPVDRESEVTNNFTTTLHVAYCLNGEVQRESRLFQFSLQVFLENRENLISQYYKEYKEALEARFSITNLTIDFDTPPNIFCGGSVTLYAAYCIGEKAETKTKVVSLSPVTSEQMVQPFIFKNVELFKIELERLGAKKIEMSSLTMPDLPVCNITGPSRILFASFCSNGQSGTSSKEISLAGISNDKLSVFLVSQAQSYEKALRSSGADPVFTNYDTPPTLPSCGGTGGGGGGTPEGGTPGGGTPPTPTTTFRPTTTTTTFRVPETFWLKTINPIDSKKYIFDITEGLFSNNERNLVTFFTGSTSENYSRYYTHIYDENPKTSLTSSIQFSIAYGHSGGSGSLDEGNKINITPTRAIYSQYRNLVLGRADVKFNLAGKETDSIYVINYQSDRLKDRLDAGVLELNIAHLSGSRFLAGGGTRATHIGSNVKLAGTNRVLRLIDDSKTNINPDYTDVGYSYNIVSGTLETGVYNESKPHYYGKLIPSLGIVLLDGDKLDLSASFATSNASEIEGYNAIKLYKSFSGSALIQDISGDYLGMKARRIIREYNDYYFIRINNREFNFTNNNSYFIYNKKEDSRRPGDLSMPLDPNSPEGIALAKRLTENNGEIYENFVNNPQVYITTVGLYNAQRELVAVGKLAKPILKNFTEESIFTVKLKY